MKNANTSSDGFRNIAKPFDIMPSDTISLVIPNSRVSPSDEFARQLEMLDSLKPLCPISSKEDANRFDTELRLFVHEVMSSAIDPRKCKDFSKIAEKKMTPEEKEEYNTLLEQRIGTLSSIEEAIKTDNHDQLKEILLKTSKTSHRLNELNPKVWIRTAMTMSVFQYSNFDGLPLGKIYEKCNGNYRIFSIFLDLKINFANLSAYIYELLGNEYDVSNLPKMLHPRMKLQFYANACVMTCRATWDKLMGVIVLIELGLKSYDQFISSSSKKKYFRKHIEDLSSDKFPKETLEEFLEVVTKLDDTFRTQEAHGSGGNIRNAAFSDGSLSNTVLIEIVGHYNYLHEYLDNFWHDMNFLDEKPNFIGSISNP